MMSGDICDGRLQPQEILNTQNRYETDWLEKKKHSKTGGGELRAGHSCFIVTMEFTKIRTEYYA